MNWSRKMPDNKDIQVSPQLVHKLAQALENFCNSPTDVNKNILLTAYSDAKKHAEDAIKESIKNTIAKALKK